MKNLNTLKVNNSLWQPMITDDSWWLNERASFNYRRLSSYHAVDYHEGFEHAETE